MAACSFSLPERWREEVLLHDGSKIIVTRYLKFKGRHEIGQRVPIGKSSISFKLPNSNKTLHWASEYAQDLGRTDFTLFALHILDGTPYIVASPNGCTSYNKWGRPNPPYVFFKHDGNKWHRIQLAEFPAVFKKTNLYINLGNQDIKALVKRSPVSAEYIKEKNGKFTRHPEFQTILREPIHHPELKRGADLTGCKELVRTEDGWSWSSPSYIEMKKQNKLKRQEKRKAAKN